MLQTGTNNWDVQTVSPSIDIFLALGQKHIQNDATCMSCKLIKRATLLHDELVFNTHTLTNHPSLAQVLLPKLAVHCGGNVVLAYCPILYLANATFTIVNAGCNVFWVFVFAWIWEATRIPIDLANYVYAQTNHFCTMTKAKPTQEVLEPEEQMHRNHWWDTETSELKQTKTFIGFTFRSWIWFCPCGYGCSVQN